MSHRHPVCLGRDDENEGRAQLSAGVLDDGVTLIARRVTSRASGFIPRGGDHVSSSGIYYATPHDVGLDAHDITIATPAGSAPAWRIDGDSASSTWAIHIHGLGSLRAGTLRGVLAATERGYTSLVIIYRADGEGPRVGNGRSTLGFTQTDDAEAAIEYAIRHGARQVVLFGWSMDAAIALQLAHHSPHRRIVAGLVLESPVLDWTKVIKANCTRSALSAAAGSLAIAWLTIRPLARMVCLPARPHPAPVLRLDGPCQGTHHPHAHPPRRPRRLRTDTALASTPRFSARPCFARGLRSRTHALVELRPRPMAERGDRLAHGTRRASGSFGVIWASGTALGKLHRGYSVKPGLSGLRHR